MNKRNLYSVNDNNVTFKSIFGTGIELFTLQLRPASIDWLDTQLDKFVNEVDIEAYSGNIKTNIPETRDRKVKTEHPLELPTIMIKHIIKALEYNWDTLNKAIAMTKNDISVYVDNHHAHTISMLITVSQHAERLAKFKESIEQFNSLLNDDIETVRLIETVWTKNLLSQVLATKELKITKQFRINYEDGYNTLNINTSNLQAAIKNIHAKFKDHYLNYSTNSRSSIVITKKDIVESDTKEITINHIYPEFERQIISLMDYFRGFDIQKMVRTGAEGRERYSAFFTTFNSIKTSLILNGYTEEKAVAAMIERGFKSRFNTSKTYPATYDFTVAKCAITGELLPEICLIPVKLLDNSVVAVNYYYVMHIANYAITQYNFVYDEKTGFASYIEQKLNGEHKRLRDVQENHEFNVLTYLSPKATNKENIEVINKDKVCEFVPFLGVELEVECKPDCPTIITDLVMESIGRDFVIFKRDGSLRGYKPFEIVSVPATLAYHKEKWLSFMENTAVKGRLQSYASGECGMHVHISKKAFTSLHLAKFIRFFNSLENRGFITKVGGRDQNTYNIYTNHAENNNNGYSSAMTHAAVCGLNGGAGKHYDCVSTSKRYPTMEIRIFRGNLAKSQFFKNLEFVHAAWAYTKNCSMKELDHKQFILWLFKENLQLYNHLQAWLIANNYNVSNKNKATKEETNIIKNVQLVVNRKFNTTDSDKLRKISKTEYLSKADLRANQ